MRLSKPVFGMSWNRFVSGVASGFPFPGLDGELE